MAIRKPLILFALGAWGLVLAGAPAPCQDKGKLAAVSKQDLTSKVPNFFSFELESIENGKRLWLRVDSKHFVERYPNGAESKFKLVGRTKVDGIQGTVVAKIGGDEKQANTTNDGSFQVFIPDRGSAKMELRGRKAAEDDWVAFATMKKVE